MNTRLEAIAVCAGARDQAEGAHRRAIAQGLELGTCRERRIRGRFADRRHVDAIALRIGGLRKGSQERHDQNDRDTADG